ncbi:hypothetical protein [Shimia sp. Alg240-R146]|uniref:hypothetical protein n=1 Tax=Shimia sp. Alg240-R146 TaxID=2993449 RepID=UPI0022E7C75F|nr:hypothetical protein [Shimia sp. Alg240-R146]
MAAFDEKEMGTLQTSTCAFMPPTFERVPIQTIGDNSRRFSGKRQHLKGSGHNWHYHDRSHRKTAPAHAAAVKN